MNLVLRLGSWDELGDEAYRIRREVFVGEQGVPVELEHDEYDLTALHVLFQDEAGHGVATGRLLPDGHVGRIAVLAPFRGRGFGRRVMQALMAEALVRGHQALQLHAQVDAEAFYAKLGFEPVGQIFMEAGIAHLGMRAKLA